MSPADRASFAVTLGHPPESPGSLTECIDGAQRCAYRWHKVRVWRGVNVTNEDTRRRLLINRHIAKMSPEEIARRFTVSYTAPIGAAKQPRPRTRAMPRLKAPD